MKKSLNNQMLVGMAVLSALGVNAFGAGLVVTVAENPNAVNSSLSNTNVFNFNSLSTGVNQNVNWNGVGTFDQLYIKTGDQYGGAVDPGYANGSKYSLQGVGTSVSSSTLTLSQSSGYFGMWWSAGDASNQLSFYNGNTLVGEFTTQNLLSPLGSAYKGNPRNRMLDSGEPFAFINFYGDKNTTWNKIVVHNKSNSGFESDNYTSRVTTYNSRTDSASSTGLAIARVSGTTVTKISSSAKGAAFWGSESAIPGAPAPSVYLLAAFGIGLLGKAKKKKLAALNQQDCQNPQG